MLILIIPIATRIHCVILTLLELVILLPLVGDHRTVHRGLEVFGDGTEDDAISAGTSFTIEGLPIGHDGEFEVWGGCIFEVEVLVIVVGVGIFVAAHGLALGLDCS